MLQHGLERRDRSRLRTSVCGGGLQTNILKNESTFRVQCGMLIDNSLFIYFLFRVIDEAAFLFCDASALHVNVIYVIVLHKLMCTCVFFHNVYDITLEQRSAEQCCILDSRPYILSGRRLDRVHEMRDELARDQPGVKTHCCTLDVAELKSIQDMLKVSFACKARVTWLLITKLYYYDSREAG